MAKVVKSIGYNRLVKDVSYSPEEIFQKEVYRAILEYTSAFKKRQRLALIKETYRTMKARQWIHREFIEPRLMSHSQGVLQ